ncbi:N-terminal Xaa-Pro-Lys N-methyltransferase 1-A [Tetranychus urticae]|uniref:Alpha N-terminal protein methyltransferase 1 n=1 Tax=Tetranychus urticae TaxID=32264 RepID=T1KAH9_TETUR|nr:N-terminal Xaa-Pro-Lys N-methyltransferase 1-A [Tetranychus urticae]
MFINGSKVTDDFYDKGANYWKTVDATIDGMLGGFAHISNIDIKGSKKFLSQFIEPLNPPDKKKVPIDHQLKSENKRRALDCGAGIGRVTKNLLLDFFHVVDLLDVNQSFLEEARNHIGPDIYDKRIGQAYCSSLHEFKPNEGIEYDVIWCQWVTGHLTDTHFIDFLLKCRQILKPDGLIIIKDNHTSSDEIDDDMNDSSVTRPHWLYKDIFTKAGLNLISEKRQYQFPKGLYPVRMFAMKAEKIELNQK